MHTMHSIAHGAVPVMLTPFTSDNCIDFDAVDELVEFYIDAGVTGLFIDCLSGEVFALTPEERLQLARRVAKRANGRIAIAAGANFAATLQEQARELDDIYAAGADIAVVLISNLPHAEDITGQLMQLAEMTDVPLGLYECPHPTHRVLDEQQVAQLAAAGRYVFMKNTTKDLDMTVRKVRTAAGSALRIFEANVRYTPDTLRAGGCGHCGIIANPCPELVAAYNNPAITDEVYRAGLQRALLALHDMMTANNYPASAKYILNQRGLRIGPATRVNAEHPLTDEQRATIRAFMRDFDFIPPPMRS